MYFISQGDSGGPLHVIMDDGRYKQIGITSFGLVLGCEKGLHAAFTRTSNYYLQICITSFLGLSLKVSFFTTTNFNPPTTFHQLRVPKACNIIVLN